MLLHNVFHVDKNNHENVPVASEGFPYACIRTELDRYAEKSISWHWHSAFEIAYLEKGKAKILTPDEEIILQQGDAVFVNSGVLHFYQAAENSTCVICSQLFDMHLLTGMYSSVYEEKYCNPVLLSETMQAWRIHPDSPVRVHMIEAVLRGIDSAVLERDGFEFEIRSHLSSFWMYLLRDTEQIRAGSAVRSSGDVERIKKMMDYVREHFSEKIGLEQIAAAGNVSVRECSRCFRRCINFSPTEYLTQVRARRAAEMLIRTDRSVLDISEACGFSSSSYFSKIFREFYGCTPNSYRHKAGSEAH